MGAIDLLFGVEGGGKPSGVSAKRIQNQLTNIIGNINKNLPGIKVTLDSASRVRFEGDITRLADHAVDQANRVQAAWNIQFPPIPPGGGGGGRGSRNPYSVFIRENSALSKAASLLKQVNSAKREWTASQSGLTAGTYDEIVRMDSALQLLIDNFRNGRMSIDDFELALSGFGEAFKDSSEMISRYGENVDVEKILKKDTIAYTNAMDKIDKLSDRYQNNYIANWTAADGGVSNDSYQSLFTLVDDLDVLKQRLESGSITFAEYRKELNRIEKAGDAAARAIRGVGEGHSIDSDEARNKKLKQAYSELSTMERNLSRWTAAEGGKSSSSFDAYFDAAANLEEAISKLKDGRITLAEFNAEFAKIQRNAAEAAAAIGKVDENTKLNVKLKPGVDGYIKASGKTAKKIFDYEEYYANWTAAGEQGSKSSKAYAGLDSVIKRLRNLQVELGQGKYTLDEYNAKFLELTNSADGYIRTIKRAKEDHPSDKILTDGSDEKLSAITELREKELGVKKLLERYSAAENGTAKESFETLSNLTQAGGKFDELRKSVESGTMSLTEYKKALKEIEDIISDSELTIKEADEDKKADKVLTKESDEQLDAIDKVNKALKTATANQKAWGAASENKDTKSAYNDIGERIEALNKLKAALDSGTMTAKKFAEQYDAIEHGLNQDYSKIQLKGMDHSKQQELEKYQKALSEINAQIEKNESNLREWSSSKFQMPDVYEELEKITNELKELQRELIRTGEASEEFKKDFTDNVLATEKVGGKIKLGDADHKSFGDSVVDVVKEMAGTIDVMDVVYRTWEIGRSMVEAVTEIDTAMTELRKVTDETDASYNAFLKEASVRAKDLGATVTDVVSSSADFARLGYDLDEASSLADAAIVYKNVGDGIDDISESSASIISTMQAFGIEAANAMSIVDKFNAVSNNYAVSSKGLGNALQKSAAALAAGGNTLDESIAMIGSANRVVQNPEIVGTTLKTVSMFLRAASTEAEEAGESTEGMASSVSELRDELLALTGGQVDIMINEDEYKSTFKILQELSAIWDDLTDVSQANILEMIGGRLLPRHTAMCA